jgi:FMN phosphatase YigB (HAD superfamily)
MLNHLTSKPKYAFFDVDDTIISNKSMFSFIKLYFEQFPMTELQHQFTEETKKGKYFSFRT